MFVCFPFAKAKRLKYSCNWNFYLHTHLTGQLSDCRSSLIQACMTTRILRFLKRHIFFSRFRWDSATGMVKNIALCLELFRFLQFVVKQDKTSLCSSSSQLHSPRGGSTALTRLGLFARSTKTAMLRAGYTSSFVTVCSAGRDIAENADKGMEVCRHGRVRLFVSVILCSSLRSSFEQFLYYGSSALGVVKSTQ